jgi:hypothetical protein
MVPAGLGKMQARPKQIQGAGDIDGPAAPFEALHGLFDRGHGDVSAEGVTGELSEREEAHGAVEFGRLLGVCGPFHEGQHAVSPFELVATGDDDAADGEGEAHHGAGPDPLCLGVVDDLAEVVVLSLELAEGGGGVCGVGGLAELQGHRLEVVAMAEADFVFLAGLAQAVQGERAEGDQHPEANGLVSGMPLEEGAPDEPGEGGRDVGHAGNGLGCLDRERAAEDPEPPEGDPMLGLEQVVARPGDPVEGGMPIVGITARRGEPEALLAELLENLSGRHDEDLGGGEFDGERHPIEGDANLGHGLGIVEAELELGIGGGGPIQKKANARVLGEFADVRLPAG